MIVLHMGLPKTASSLFLHTLFILSDMILIQDIYNLEAIDQVNHHHPGYINLNNHDKIIIFNKYMDVSNYGESTINTCMSINFEDLHKDKVYFIKNPLLIIENYDLLIEKIKKAGHEVKVIVGVRNLIDATYSLRNHWKVMPLIDVYKNVLIKFYENIDTIVKNLTFHKAIIYNFDNLVNFKSKDFIIKLLDEIKFPIIINHDLLVSNIIINHYEDTENIKKYIENYDKIQDIYNDHFKNIVITRL